MRLRRRSFAAPIAIGAWNKISTWCITRISIAPIGICNILTFIIHPACMSTLTHRIKEFNRGLLKKPLGIKYAKLSENPFSFLRGTCHLFYEDISKIAGIPDAPLTWCTGDLHLENFGSYKGNNRLVYFDVNDFGEAILLPASWELIRLVTSIFVAFDSLKISHNKAAKAAELFLHEYSQVLRKGKAVYLESQTAKGIVKKFLKRVSKRTQNELLVERTQGKQNKLSLLIDNNRHFEVKKALKKKLHEHITNWMSRHPRLKKYRCADIAFHISGLGSLGVHRYCLLLQHSDKPKTYLLLDMKEATPSSVLSYAKSSQAIWFSEGERICCIQDYMQNACPALLSATRFEKADYVIKELQPSSDKLNFKLLKEDYDDICRVISDMALLLASAHLRSSGRKGAATADELIQFSNDPMWQEKVFLLGKTYSQVVKQYYREYKKEFKAGAFDV
jgi:uncharacterized protein (DUF2252 family)